MTTTHSISELMHAQRLFNGLDETLMARLASEAKLANYAAGDTLITENSPNQQLFLIVEGRASATSNGTRIGKLGAGELAGEISSARISPPVATVRADSPLTAISFPIPLIAEIAGSDQGFSRRLRQAAFHRISG